MAIRKNAQGSKGQTRPAKQPYGGAPKPRRPLPAPGPPPPVENGDSDPPIIISGGSVTIESTVFLSVSFDAAKQKYIYENKDLKVGKMKMKGKKAQEDDSDNGKLTIELFKE